MKIRSIRINTDCSVMTIGGRRLIGVILTVGNWWGRTQEIKAYPTNYGLTSSQNNILYYYFCDELGEEFDDDTSQQINNYLLIQEMTLKF